MTWNYNCVNIVEFASVSSWAAGKIVLLLCILTRIIIPLRRGSRKCRLRTVYMYAVSTRYLPQLHKPVCMVFHSSIMRNWHGSVWQFFFCFWQFAFVFFSFWSNLVWDSKYLQFKEGATTVILSYVKPVTKRNENPNYMSMQRNVSLQFLSRQS